MTTLYLVLAAYFAVLFGIGIAARTRIKGMEDYLVGGKRLGYWVVAFSARATGESAWLLLGLTGLGAMVGLSGLWVVLGEVLGVAGAWLLMARPFKQLTDRYESITVPDFLVSHFDDGSPRAGRLTRRIRLCAAVVLTVFVTIYVSAQIDATGKAFEDFLSWNYYTGILTGFAIVVLYTFFGGFVAVAWSDLFQGSLMAIGLVLVPVAAWLAVPEGGSVLGTLASVDPGLVSLWGPGGPSLDSALLIVSYLAIGLGFLGSPQVFVRFMSLGSVDALRQGRWVAIFYTLITDTGAVLTGVLGRYLLVGPEDDVEGILGGAAEGVLPAIVEYLFPAIIVGIFVAAVLSAIMSTIDSLLVVASSAITRDYTQQLRGRVLEPAAMTRLSRTATLGMALGALAIALLVSVLSPDRTVFWFVIFGWSGIASTFCPVIILTLSWRGYRAEGVLASMVVGFLSIPFFKFAVPAFGAAGESFALMGEMAPSFATAMLAGVIASRIAARRD
ncbi:MAG: sodium/proline symporter [Rhodothermales bacterium]|nr:sodium/proline symporter [Rhodothermales bacterium]MBO6780189.1 sodium/proline symporter [Rhodothermales bacterium]